MIYSGQFNHVSGDRAYLDSDVAAMMSLLTGGPGVIDYPAGGLLVSQVTGLQISVAAGGAWLGKPAGWYYLSDEAQLLNLDSETSGYNRIDRVVLRLDRNTETRAVTLAAKKGAATTGAPAAPALTQNDTVYELSLSRIAVTGGSTSIVITDERSLIGTSSSSLISADIINALSSAATDKPLSAAMGKALQDSTVKLSGDQSVAGVKTFSNFPVTPSSAPTANYQTANKKYVDDTDADSVKTSGNQTIAGIKTFSSFPVTPSSAPTSNYQVANRKFVTDQDAILDSKFGTDALTLRGEIPTDYSSFNAATAQGLYAVNDYSGAPGAAKFGVLAVYRYGNYIVQTYYPVGAYAIYTRTYNSSAWSSWARVDLQQYGISLGSSNNANTSTVPGVYKCAGTTTANNFPYPYGIFEVIENGSYILQRMTDFNGSAAEKRRTYNGSAWTAWA